MDGRYYSPYHYGTQYKFATALKGNPTLFYPLDPSMRTLYENYNQEFWKDYIFTDIESLVEHAEEERIVLSQMFDVNNAESPKQGERAFFIVGDHRFAALHSEPKINSKRLFISIVPGQECEILELEKE
jgi:hypothetical protein